MMGVAVRRRRRVRFVRVGRGIVGLGEGGIDLLVGLVEGGTVLVVGPVVEIGIVGALVGVGVGIGLVVRVGPGPGVGIVVGGIEGSWSHRSLGVGFRHKEVDQEVENHRSLLVAGVEGRLRRVAAVGVEKHRMVVEMSHGVEVDRVVIEEVRCRRYGKLRWVGKNLVVLILSNLLVDHLRAENSQIRCFLLAAAINGISIYPIKEQDFNIPDHDVHQTFHQYSPLIHPLHRHAAVAAHQNSFLTAENYSASSLHQVGFPPECPQRLRSNAHRFLHGLQKNHLPKTS